MCTHRTSVSAYDPLSPGFSRDVGFWRQNRTRDGFNGRLNAELSELHVGRPGAKRRKVIGPQDEGADFNPSRQLDPKFGINAEDIGVDQAAFGSSDKPGGTNSTSAQQPPRRVMFTSRMKDDLDALFKMTQDDSHPSGRSVLGGFLF